MSILSNYLILLALSLATIIATISATNVVEPLSECGKHIGSHCGDQVINALSIYKTHEQILSQECCYRVIQTRYSCHNLFTLYLLQADPRFQSQNKSEIITKSNKIFDRCDKFTKPAISELLLLKCVEKIGTKCGKEVYDKLVHGMDDVTKECCRKLMEMGLSCHYNMAKALIRTPALRDVDAHQFLKKSSEIV